MRPILTCILSFLMLGSSLFAQDKIYRKNGKVVEARIVEVGSTEVKYKIFGDENSPIYVLETDRISKVVMENGTVEKFIPNIKDPEAYVGQLNKAIKVDFFGPLLGYSQISYEKSTGIGRGYEVTLGIIGAGKNQRYRYASSGIQMEKRNQFGVSGTVAYKFNKLPDIFSSKVRFTHLMQGTYIKPALYFGHYAEDLIARKTDGFEFRERQKVNFASLQLEGGQQWVYGERLLIDTYFGLGYTLDNKKRDGYENNDLSSYNYITARLGRSPGIGVSWGLKVGWLLK